MRQNYPITLILLLFSMQRIVAQDEIVFPHCNYVIASTLRLRESPDKTAKILTTIPFGSRVKFLNNRCYKKENTTIKLEQYDVNLEGCWVYVQYKNMKGYILNSYLSCYKDPEPTYKYLNKDFILLFPGCGCNQNEFDPSAWNFYGFYKSVKDTFDIRKITITNISDFNDHTCSNIISVSEPKNLQFIIGSKKPFLSRTKKLYGKEVEITFDPSNKNVVNNLSSIGLELVDKSGRRNDEDFSLYINNEDKKQDMISKSVENYYPARVNFAGDIDLDGKTDFIITYGEKGSKSVLYLSSEAAINQLIKMVSIFFSGYCC